VEATGAGCGPMGRRRTKGVLGPLWKAARESKIGRVCIVQAPADLGYRVSQADGERARREPYPSFPSEMPRRGRRGRLSVGRMRFTPDEYVSDGECVAKPPPGNPLNESRATSRLPLRTPGCLLRIEATSHRHDSRRTVGFPDALSAFPAPAPGRGQPAPEPAFP
jgi:hypothetical protein